MAPLTKSSSSDIAHLDNSFLPDDILDHMILPRLPFKTLKRFQCVSKRYRSLIGQDPLFPSEQARLLSPSSTDLVHLSGNGRLSFLIKPESIGVPDPSLQFLGSLSNFDLLLLCSTNGLLLFYGNFKDLKSHICLCNPATQEKVSVPAPHKKYMHLCNMGLVFDPIITPNQYLLVNPKFDTKDGHGFGFEIFRFYTGEWTRSNKIVNVNETFPYSQKRVHAQGVIYWLFCRYIMWYHTEKDLAGSVPLPTTGESEYWSMGIYADGVVCCHTCVGGVEVWRLTNGTHWDRLHCITWDSIPLQINYTLLQTSRCEGNITLYKSRFSRPLAFDGQFLYLLDYQKMFSKKEAKTQIGSYAEIEGYNISTQQLEKKSGIFITTFEFDGQAYDYHNSMASLPKIL